MTRSSSPAMGCARAGGGPAWRSTVALAGLLCAGGTSWLVFNPHASGAHERGEPPLAGHMLRDAATALPAVLAAGIPLRLFHCHYGSHEDFDMTSQFEVQTPLPPPAAGDRAAPPLGAP